MPTSQRMHFYTILSETSHLSGNNGSIASVWECLNPLLGLGPLKRFVFFCGSCSFDGELYDAVKALQRF